MKHKKLTAILLALTAALSGCSDARDRDLEYVDVSDIANVSKPNIAPVDFGDSSDSSGNSQTAEIDFSVTEYNVCIAEFGEYDAEKVKTSILGNIDITPEIIERDRDKYPIYKWNKGDLSLYVDNNSPDIELVGNLSALADALIDTPTKNSDGNIELFERRNENLDFCTIEDATANVVDILAKCGVNVCENAEVYALHQSDMQKVVDEKCAKGTFYDFKSYLTGGELEPVTSYVVDKSDECYYMVFHEEYGGVPLYNENLGYESIKDLTIFHPEIKAIYCADGLVGLSVDEYRSRISEVERITQLITPEAAAHVVQAKYADVMGIEKIEFDKLELMYAITPNYIDGKINIYKAKMIPAWVCTVRITGSAVSKQTGREELATNKKRILIDARTGEEII